MATILVIDDSEPIRHTLKRTLARAGFDQEISGGQIVIHTKK